MTKRNTVSAVENIERQIAELEALKLVVEYIESELNQRRESINEYEQQIEESEAEGVKVESWDWRREYIINARKQISALLTVQEKLTK